MTGDDRDVETAREAGRLHKLAEAAHTDLTAAELLIILAILDTHKPPPPTRLVVAVEAAMDAAYRAEEIATDQEPHQAIGKEE